MAVTPRNAVSQSTSMVSPILGLNTRDGLGDMDPRYAVQLDNFFPQNSSVDLRTGNIAYATGMTGVINTLIPWNGPSADKLFAANGANIYEVTGGGVVGAAVVTGKTSDKWQYQNITTSGGSFVWFCDGADAPYHYDGVTFTNPAITGVTSSSIVNVTLHQNRLFLCLNNDINAYYLPTSAIAGAVTKFPLGAVFRLGGYLMSAISVSRDSGTGMDDYMAFISSNGEIAIYQGSDPATAGTWGLVGVYHIGRPIGRRCAFKYGGDAVVITQDGLQSISKMMNVDQSGADAVSLTNIISPTFNADARSYGTFFGWQGVIHPRAKWLMVNVPQSEGSLQYQYVMNTVTGAWCRFTMMNGNCWCVSGNAIYFGGNDGRVMLADSTTYLDDGGFINGNMKMAYSYFGLPGLNKHFKMIRALVTASAQVTYNIGINVDYKDSEVATPGTPSQSNSNWGIALWGINLWGGVSTVIKNWKGLNKVGFSGSINLNASSFGSSLSVVSFDVVYEKGGVL